MSKTIILPCTCTHEGQDQIYGAGRRLHNICQKKGEKAKKAYCTVCSPRQPKVKQTTQVNSDLGMVTIDKMDQARNYKTF